MRRGLVAEGLIVATFCVKRVESIEVLFERAMGKGRVKNR